MPRPNLYIDVDGVILGRRNPDDSTVVQAHHAEAFLEFALADFDCYWLTTHCDGDTRAVLVYLSRHCTDKFMALAAQVRPTKFRTLKTEALCGDFYWVDDSPLATEVAWLKQRRQLDRWIEVNTRRYPDDLQEAIARLTAVLQPTPAR